MPDERLPDPLTPGGPPDAISADAISADNGGRASLARWAPFNIFISEFTVLTTADALRLPDERLPDPLTPGAAPGAISRMHEPATEGSGLPAVLAVE